MEILLQYGLFLAKAVTLVAAILFVVGTLATLVRQAREQLAEQLDIKNINRRYETMAEILNQELMSPEQNKEQQKLKKKEQKAEAKAAKKGHKPSRPKLFVLDFDGDIRASAVENLREEISAILQVAKAEDEVLVKIESGGGLVHSYGLAASQLRRLRDKDVRLVVAIDRVAASGGYMMAGVAEHIIAAPFAIVGSIGVIAQIPNFNKVLKKNDIDFEMITAGEYKRTLTMFGENDDKAREKFREEIQDTHELFKEFLLDNRPNLDLDKVATGEHWYGKRALEMGLIDEIKTSDDYLLQSLKTRDIYTIAYKTRQALSERLSHAVQAFRKPMAVNRHDAVRLQSE
ncbi:MAG: protease SohB [Oceanococcus sp.]